MDPLPRRGPGFSINSWPLLAHPIRYIWDSAATREVVLVGNPLLWWGFLAALPLLVYRVARYRRWQALVVLGGYLLLYGPWLVIPRTKSSSTCPGSGDRRGRLRPGLAVPVGAGRLAAVPAPHPVVRSGRTITS